MWQLQFWRGQQLWDLMLWVLWFTYKRIWSWVKFYLFILNDWLFLSRVLCWEVERIGRGNVLVRLLWYIKVYGFVIMWHSRKLWFSWNKRRFLSFFLSLFLSCIFSKVIFPIWISSIIIYQQSRVKHIPLFRWLSFDLCVFSKIWVNTVVCCISLLFLFQSISNWWIKLLLSEIGGCHL